MAFTATENFRSFGVLYTIGDPVPDDIATQNGAWCTGSGAIEPIAPVEALIASKEPLSLTVEIDLEATIMRMLRKICELEGLDAGGSSRTKSELITTLLSYYLAAGMISAEGLAASAKPVPVIFEEPFVDPVLPELDPKMTVKALTQIAEAETVTIGEGATKAEIIGAIAAKRAADNPGPRAEELE